MALALLAGVLFTSTAATAASGLVTFEESIPSPENVQTQYCNAASLNKGVEFLLPVRIVEPDEGSESPTHAATNEFVGAEFEELNAIEIGFTAPQTTVTVSAGLDKQYSFSVTAHLRAYSTDTPGGTPVATATRSLGTGPTPVEQGLTVTSRAANIRSIDIEFLDPSETNAAIEWIDDLSFDNVGPLCVTDTVAPVVIITKPAIDGGTTFTAGSGPATTLLGFVAADGTAGTGIAKVIVEYRDSADALLDSFKVCGAGLPACELAPAAVDRTFYTSVPRQTTKIVVKAWDFADNLGSSQRTVNVAESTMNLYAQSLEITQGTQSWLPMNTTMRSATTPEFFYPAAPTAVPLVAGRRTVVRLYPEVEGTTLRVDGVGARLRCFTDSFFVQPCTGPSFITPEHRTDKGMSRTIPVRPADDLDARHRSLGFSWTFLLPPAWSEEGTIFLEGEVDPPLAMTECSGCDDAANKIRVTYVRFRTVPDYDDLVVSVMLNRFFPNGSGMLPPVSDVKRAAETIRAMYPVDGLTIMRKVGIYGYEDKLSQQGKNACKDLLNRMQSSFSNQLQTHEVIFALGDNEVPMLCSGLGRFNGVTVARGNRPDAVVQEIAHGVQLYHAGPPPGHGSECQEIQGMPACDSDWPWAHGTIGAFGFDTYRFQVVPEDRIECDTPGVCDDDVDNDGDSKVDEECVGSTDLDPPADWMNDPHDFMSYGGCKFWTSPRTWIRLFNAFTNSRLPYPTASSAATAGIASPNEETADPEISAVAVRGTIEEDGSWMLHDVFELPGVAAPQAIGSGSHGQDVDAQLPTYQVEFRDGAGNVVASHVVELTFDIVHTDDPNSDLLPPPSFSAVLPSPGAFQTVQLTTDEAVLASRTRSEHAPAIELLSPTDDGFDPLEPRVAWTATDEDGEAVEVMIQMYVQGAWDTIAFGLSSGEVPIVLDRTAGGPSQVRVIASDGVNSTIVVSPMFELVDRAPTVAIVAPDQGATHQSGDRVGFVGTAYDLEDGVLAEGALRWSSDRDGDIGRGSRLDVASLSIGTHEVTLRATDSAGHVAEEVVVVTVEARPTINIQPIAHAGGDASSPVDVPVALDGAGSSDGNGDVLTYHWSIATGPVGATAVLSDANSALPVLTVDTVGTYVLSLDVHDGELGSLPDQVTVTVTGPTGDLAVTELVPLVDPPPALLVGDTSDFSYNATVAFEGVSPVVAAEIDGTVTSAPGLTITPGSLHRQVTLASGASETLELAYNATCIAPGTHTARVTAAIAGSDPDFVDTNLTNNTLAVDFTVECVLPVAINVVPGSERNGIKLRHGVVSVAVLTTDAGEYGLPVAFDATHINPLSARFGTRDEVWAGSGAVEAHARGHVEDALERDEVTFDGDEDMVLHFMAGATSLQVGDTTACAEGNYVTADGTTMRFFGCDTVLVPR